MRYFAREIHIENFRKLKDIVIELGKNITVFSGINGVGKSNIMSLIAMMFGTSGTRIAKGNFFPQFDDYFIITEEEYFAQKNKNAKEYRAYIKINVEDYNNTADFIQKRMGLKDDSRASRGIRVLPRSTNYFSKNGEKVSNVAKETKDKFGIGDSSRIPVPTIFISLSRLFPMGETKLEEVGISDANEIVRRGIIDQYIEWYNRVLPNSIDEVNYSSSRIKKYVNNNGRIHVELIDSDVKTQSMGEDNLGTIISALIDFYYLKKKLGSEYNGGIICIDEIDASLHPSAQIRLFNLLCELSESLSLQIFLTTHSMTLLERIIKKSNQKSDEYKLVYILDPKYPRIKEKISSIEDIKADMYDDGTYYKPIIKVYCEDEETQFIFEELAKILNFEESNKSTDKTAEYKLPLYKVFPMSLDIHN